MPETEVKKLIGREAVVEKSNVYSLVFDPSGISLPKLDAHWAR